jgi:hypothetical protein
MMEARTGNEYWAFNPEARHGAGEFRYNWARILPDAAQIVRGYSGDVTLRQLFYRLVASERLPNLQRAYQSLSSNTAEARRGDSKWYPGTFPGLMDRGRDIDRPLTWESAANAADWLAGRYREDRVATQETAIYLGVEKNALRGLLWQWFSNLGLPIIALGGFASQTLVDQVFDDVREQGDKPSVLIYGGDFDADGEDIQRDFVERTGAFDEVVRIALNEDQIAEFNLPPQPGKHSSSRARGFAEKYVDIFEDVYGMDLVQIELDAIPPDELQRLYQEAIDNFFDHDAYDDVLAHEREERAKVEALAEEGGE